MPRIKGIPGPYRVFFTSFEPIELARSHGFSAQDLNTIRRLINSHRAAILEAWHEHCG
jgi:hypothetical protein